jgi:hypothetical protein
MFFHCRLKKMVAAAIAIRIKILLRRISRATASQNPVVKSLSMQF